MPDWIRQAVWWQVYPLGFLGAEADNKRVDGVAHRLRNLEPWLDYAVELGASGVVLGPIFAAATHGYDTIDHFRIDSRLGDDADFDALVRAMRGRGLKLLLDGVFNHVGRGFPAFQAALAQGPAGPMASWFHLSWPSDAAVGVEPDCATFEGHHHLVVLNHDEPAVMDHAVRVMDHWLARGADGWRLDAAYAVPAAFWSAVLPRVRAAHPHAYFVGEVIHGDYSRIVQDSGLDAVTQYELWKAIWSSLNDRNLFELAWALGRHNAFLDRFVPLTFVGNHDVTRLASRVTDERHLPHALAILLTCGGTPVIYSGDEQAFRGIKENRAGGDDAIRPAFPATPDRLAPYGWPVFRLHQRLIGLRRRHPWLHHAKTTVRHLANAHISYELRHGDDALVVALNLDDASVRLPVPQACAVLIGAAALEQAGQESAHATLPPHGWAILGV